MSEIRCPMCAHMNPEGSLHCEKCDARLVPMGDIGKALNLPPDSQPEEDDLSAFLEKIVDEGGQDATIEDGIDEEVLSWLDDEHPEQIDEDLPESVTEEEEDEEPDFRSLIEEEIDEKAITNWLTKASDEEGETEEKPDWMTLVVSEPDEDLSDVESWFDQSDEASAEEADDQKETTKEELFTAPLPDWLDEQPDKMAFEDVEAVDFTAQLPDWMEATGGEVDEPFDEDEVVEEEETQADEVEELQFTAQLPGWMTEVEDSAEVSESEVLPEEEELPDWFTQELDEETLEQLEPPSTESVQEDAGSKQVPIPKVSTGALPWMGEEPLGEEFAEGETSPEEFELPTASVEPSPVEKLPRIQTGALPWLSNEREEDEWVPSAEGEDESEEIFAPEAESTEPDFEEVPAEEAIVEPSTSMHADEDFAMPLDEFIVEDISEAGETLSSDEEEIESKTFEDVMAEEESFFTEESLSLEPAEEAPAEEAPAEEATEVEGAADVSRSWSKFLETADKLGAEEELPEWFAKTGGGKPNQPAEPEQDESVEAEEPGDSLSVEPEIGEPAKPEPPAKKRQSTWTLLFGRGKKNKESKRLEPAETLSEPVAEPEPEAEPEISEPEPASMDDEATAEPAQAGEWDLSTILSDSQPLTTEPDDETIAEEIKGDLTDSAWLVDEDGKPLVEEIDEDQSEGDAEETKPEAKPGLTMPQEENQKEAEALADGMSSLDRLTAALGLGEEEDIEELADEDLIGFAGTTELPAWMMGDVDQEAEATAMLDAALGETKMQPEAMTADLPDWLEEADEDIEEEEAILLPEPEDQAVFEETAEVDEVEEPEGVVSTAELPAWLEDEEIEEEDDLITPVSGELPDSKYTDWLAEFEVDDEPEQTTDETDKAEAEDGTAVLPDWLLESDQETDTSDEEIEDLFPATSALTGSTAGLPDWLSTYADDDEEEEIAEVTPVEIIQEPDDLDDWLTESEDEQPLVVSDTDELNEWVQEHGIQFPTMEEDEEPSDDEVIPVDVRKDLPDWVFELEPEDEGEPIPELNGAGTAELPAWLVSGDESPDVAESHQEEPAEEEFFDFLAPDDNIAATNVFTLDDEFDEEFVEEDDDLRSLIISESAYAPTVELDSQSEWLSSYGEEESSPETSLDDEEVHEVEEIPDWVQLADTSGEWEEGTEAFGEALKFDTFEEETIKEIPNEERNIQLMERILLSEKKAVPVARTRQRNRQLTLRLTITLLMIVLVALGLYYLPIPQPNFIANAPLQVVQFHQQMQYFQQTAPDKPVLMVFDLQPAYEGELSVYAELPLKALMQNDARIFTFSTVPEGAALAQKMMVDVVMENNLVYNTQSQAMNLGYLPGGAAAIRDFALNMRFTVHGLDVGVNGVYVWEHPSTSDIDSLDDFAMVIVMTDDLDKARLWIEQSSLYLPASTPLLMVSSAKVTPLLKPYLLSGQLGGLIGNPIDAAAYATLSNESSQVIYFWKAYELGIYLMMASVFGGAVYLIVNQLRKEKNGTMRGGK